MEIFTLDSDKFNCPEDIKEGKVFVIRVRDLNRCGMEYFKQQALRYIKEDIKIGKKNGLIKDMVTYGELPNPYGILIVKWMRRFGITDEELTKAMKED